MTNNHLKSAEATFAAAERIGRARPPIQDYSGAPEAVHAFVELAMSKEPGSSAIYDEPTEALKRLGATAAPWLKRIVLDGSEFHPQPRSNAAAVMAQLGQWDDLMEAMNAAGWDTPNAAEGAFGFLIRNGPASIVDAYIPAIEAIALKSLSWPARASAIRILGNTHDERYLPVLTASLTFSGWISLLEDARGSPENIARPLKRILFASARHEDYEVRTHSMRCLGASESPAAIPALLEMAMKTGESFHRATALEALSNIAKVNFGAIPNADMPNTRTACGELLPTVWSILQSADSSAPSGLEKIAAQLEDAVSRDLSGSPARIVLDSWTAWWETRKAAPLDSFKEEIVRELSFPEMASRVRLLSSGQVETHGFFPGGSGGGSARFTDLDGFEEYVKAVAEHWLSRDYDSSGSMQLRTSIIRWIETEVVPKFRAAQKNNKG